MGSDYREPLYDAAWDTDVDHDGFDAVGGVLIWWDNNSVNYSTFADIFTNVGIYQNGIEVDSDLIFTDKTVSPTNNLTLAAGTNAAVDAGAYVPNLADFYLGTAPDLGAHERGATAIPYEPRDSGTPSDQHTRYWAKH